MKVSHSADCQLYAQLWKLQQNWELTTHLEETPTQLNKMFCTDTKSKERVLRSLSPVTLQSMPCWVSTTSCVSLLLETGRLSNKLTHGQDLHKNPLEHRVVGVVGKISCCLGIKVKRGWWPRTLKHSHVEWHDSWYWSLQHSAQMWCLS